MRTSPGFQQCQKEVPRDRRPEDHMALRAVSLHHRARASVSRRLLCTRNSRAIRGVWPVPASTMVPKRPASWFSPRSDAYNGELKHFGQCGVAEGGIVSCSARGELTVGFGS